jgi:hypothetical protein
MRIVGWVKGMNDGWYLKRSSFGDATTTRRNGFGGGELESAGNGGSSIFGSELAGGAAGGTTEGWTRSVRAGRQAGECSEWPFRVSRLRLLPSTETT